MHDPIAASRRNIARAAAIQALVVMVAALACLPFTGAAWAAGVVAGGGGLALGGWLAGRIALGGGVSPAAGALARLVAAVAVKWVVALAVLALAVALAGWPPVAVLAGVVVALVAQVLALTGR